MPKTSFGSIDIYKVSVSNQYDITKISIGDTIVYAAGNTVTYRVDTSLVYTEYVDSGETVLSPKSFTPTKTGYNFVGWRQDNQANGTVINTLAMGNDPITLYAVFRQSIIVTYYYGSSTAHTVTLYKYYNNGNSVNPTYTLAHENPSGWVFRGWTSTSAPNGDILYASITNMEITSNITVYQAFEKTITLTVYNYSPATSYSQKAYSNGGDGGSIKIYPKFTVNATVPSGWTFRGWSTNAAEDAAINYSAINNMELSSDTTLYTSYYKTITVSYNSNGGTGTTPPSTGTAYLNCTGRSGKNPNFTLAQNAFSRANYSFVQWRMGSTSGAAYAPGTVLGLSANTVFYAEWTRVSNPFYVINGYNVVSGYNFYWNVTYAYNEPSGISVGGTIPGYTANSAQWAVHHGANESLQTNVNAVSNAIPTGGNQHVRIVGSVPSGSHGVVNLSVNGTTLVQTDGVTEYKDFDQTITLSDTTTSIAFSLSINPYPYDMAYIWINQIYFY